MPLTPEERRAKVVAAGLDPSKYDWQEGESNDQTNQITGTFPPPEPTSPPAPEAPLGMGGAITARAKRALLPGLAALPGIGYGAELGSALGPIGSVVGGIVGGFGTGYVGQRAQEPLLKYAQGEANYNKGLQQYEQAGRLFPIASALTDVGVGSGVGFSPSLSGLRGLAKLPVGVPLAKLSAEEVGGLTHSLINAGVGGGLEAGQELYNEGKVDPAKVAIAGAGGLVFSKPRFNNPALGGTRVSAAEVTEQPEPQIATGPILDPSRLLMLKREMGPVVQPKVENPMGSGFDKLKELLDNAQESPLKDTGIIPPERQIPAQTGGPIISEPSPLKNYTLNDVLNNSQVAEKYYSGKPINAADLASILRIDTNKANNLINEWNLPENTDLKPSEPEGKASIRTIDEGVKYPTDNTGVENLQKELKVENQVKQPIVSPNKTSDIISSTLDKGDEYLNNLKKEKVEGRYYQPALKPEEGVKKSVPFLGLGGEQVATLRGGNVSETPIDYKDNINQWFRDSVDETGIERGKRFVKNGPEYDPVTGKRLLQPKQTAEEVSPSTLTNEDQQFNRDFANKRGVTLKEGGEVLNPETNQPVRGYSDPAARVAGLTDIATRDTGAHEIGGHQYVEDLLGSTLQADRKFAAEGIKAAGGDKEKLAEAVGKRIVDINDAPLKSWLQDFWSNSKRMVRLGGDEDQIKLAARRARDDRAFSESPELSGTTPTSTESTPATSKVFYSNQGEGSPDKKELSKGIPGITPALEVLRQQNPKAAEAFTKFLDEQRTLTGLTNEATSAADKIKDKAAFVRRAYELVHNGASDIKLSPADQAIADQLRGPLVKVHEIQRAEGMTPKGVGLKDNPNYYPQQPDQSVMDAFAKNTPEVPKLRQDYINHLMSKDPSIIKDVAEKTLNDYLKKVSNPSGYNSPEFKALRAHAGKGLPFNWIEKDPARAMQRYFTNAARDIAFYKHIQSNPEMRALFNVPDINGSTHENSNIPPINHPVMKTLFKQLTGDRTYQEGLGKSIEHGVRAGVLGPVTGAANFASALVHTASYLPVKDQGNIVKAFNYLSQGLKDSMDMGINRYQITDLESGARLGVSYYADKIKSLGDIIRKYTGTNLIEQYSRAHTMMAGELTAQASWARAAKGDVEALHFLRQFGDKQLDYKNTAPSREEILKIATNLTERVQGSYNAKELPAFLLESSSPLYWMLSLNKWSIGRANIVKADVINPALQGDFGPLLKYTLAATIGGAAVSEMRQLANNKKSPVPTLKELSEKGDAADYAYKATAILNAAGFGGIILDVAKGFQDKANKNRVNMPGMPSYEIGGEIANNFMDATTAVAEGQNPFDTYLKFAGDTIVNTVQVARVLANNTYKVEDNRRADEFRDLKTYKKLNGEKVSGPDNSTNYYENTDVRRFKQAPTLEEGQQILRDEIMPRLAKLDPETRKKELEGIRRNSYQTIPEKPLEAQKYKTFIEATQGKEAADKLFKEHQNQKIVNIQKSARVPRL